MEQNEAIEAFDQEERDLIESVEALEWQQARDVDDLRAQATKYARETLLKNKRINIRISERDLMGLKARALEEGIPYQTLVSMLIHKYLTGRLHEKSS
jgi:predicted DNA binding CopG/RHH family protein